MKLSVVRRVIVIVPVLVVALFIAGCDKGPSGTYKLDGPIPMGIEFKSGKAIFSMAGETHKESDYTVSGDKVNIAKDPDGQAVSLTINSDGSLTGPNGLKFVKSK
jgi:hypothetical protein